MLTTRTALRSRRSGTTLFGTQASRAPRQPFGGWIVGSSTPEATKASATRVRTTR